MIAQSSVPHIAFFSGDITRSGGTENVSVMIANALAETGEWRVSFVSLFEEADRPFFAIDGRIGRFTLYPVPTHGIQHYFDTCARLRRMVREQHFDVLVDIDGILDMYSLPVKRATGVKVVSWEHFNYLQNPSVPYRKLTRRWAARSADAIVTLTEADRKLYERYLKLRCPIVAIPNPMTAVEPEPVYDADSHLIISSGRLTYQKGFDMAVDAAARVLPGHPDWTWVILGEGEDRPMLERKIAEAGLEGRLILQGRVENMDDWYRKAAMFVLTSRFEGLPMVLLEAKAHRLPIVSFDCPTGPSDIIEDGVNGVLISCFDIAAMAEAISALIDDDAKRAAMAEHTVAGAERFDRTAILRQWTALLASLTEQPRHETNAG
ncbi:glycosyltransferase family 4 protein [Bifidobacterium pullorum subsp. saeculare]|uniref:Glycosyltransferase family 4 protein n=1 Tax=Bifidobacterium pullorum subsp. saeculare TaxID=78257 RepID=A0A939B9V9_9BIFI|nr:glycosyltransferase family 4 protein [Bifidobacterium pullorum]MBM6699650.1 glycosyltransferase family 4 protein [Bifidobacterium pullorum subsp. saeculare]